ncbi:MAG: 16S rRNA (guanine(527)-N(7))-methyltransferase RsmG [Candidatus Gastranaerophilales bacterium]|nr:16S rRNA (guanine(527)-N(7))-methyltransferase RsmG [Candidatus Gastranaerophilales bacterium]
MTKTYLKQLKTGALGFGITLDDDMLLKFEEYKNFLTEYNTHTNLISNTDLDEIFVKHFLDCLSFGVFKDKANFDKIIDIGAGGGFPSAVMAIALPCSNVTAVDSIAKKTKFLELLAAHLGLKNLEVVNARAEELGADKKYREKFSLSTTRAVARLSVISEYCIPFVEKGGHFLAFKALSAQEEISEAKTAVHTLGASYKETFSYELKKEESYSRNLLLFEKIKTTPALYPRQIGIPKKSPIL